MAYLIGNFFAVYVVLWFVLFNFQSLDRVYNKCFGGDNITFYAFPKQSKYIQLITPAASPSSFLVISVHTVSHIRSTSLVFLSTHEQNMKQ